MRKSKGTVRNSKVALRKESVDRNTSKRLPSSSGIVALRKESVDRNNLHLMNAAVIAKVALRKESVDRNDLPG